MRKTLTLMLLVWSSMTALGQTVTLTLTNAPCNMDGVVTANFSGFTPPLTVTWYTYTGNIVNTGVMTTSDVLTNWAGGNVVVRVVDAANNIDLTSIQSYPLTYGYTVVPAVCPAQGTITANIMGGTPPYTQVWYDQVTMINVGTTNPVSVPEGEYGIVVTDANGCVYGSPYNADSVLMWDSTSMQVAITTAPANCTNGSATITGITGGTPPYTYLWNNSATTNSISGLMMGQYTVDVTDANGCDQTEYVNVPQSITIGANVTVSPATCLQNDGSATSFGSGGMQPYTYQWSNTATTQTIGSLSAGNYNVTVTDANGCIGNGYANVFASTPITVTHSTTSSSCTAPTGSATLTINGGTPPYTTVWNTFPVQTGVTVSGVPAGNYSFTVTDAVGCVRTGIVPITPVNIVGGNFSVTSPSCTAANGALSFNPTGGTAPYTYLWSTSATTQSISGLTAGSYNVAVTDAVGCTRYSLLYLSATTPISIGLSTTPASCIFTNDGAVTATPTGGTSPYTYSWSTGGTTNTISGLDDGNYWVHVTDANGCTKTNWTAVPYDQTTNSCYCTVTGTVYNDANTNCTQDLGESGIPNIQMHLSGVGYAYTNANGDYSFKVPSGSYTLSETVNTFYPLSGCQNNAIAVNATASSGCTITNDFANTVATIHSVRVSAVTVGAPPVPGNSYYLNTIITNQGTVPEAGLIASFKADGQFPAPVFSPSGYYTGGTNDYYTMGATALSAGASLAIMKNYSVPTNIPMGTSVVFKDSASYTAPMSNWLNDYSPWNNVSYYNPIVLSSYDPNYKEVSPKGTGTQGTITPQDSVLEYTVHFQNLGTYMAQNIVVLDTIDSDLDLTTLRPIYSSHPASVTVSDAGELRYTFNNINLPAAMDNELLSNGFFIYSIEMKPNRPFGTQFTNSAAIYFDYNAPVITNTTLNTLGWPTNVNNTTNTTEGAGFSLYPNPANNMFYAMISSEVDASAGLSVVDVSGKVVVSKTLSLQKGAHAIPVDVASLTPGLYFVTYSLNGKKQTQKLVIMQ
jgi:hypothetical protein